MANFAFGLGVGTKSNAGDWLEVYYNAPLLGADDKLIDAVAGVVGYEGGNEAIEIDAATLKKLESAFLSVGAEDQALITEVLEGSKQPLVICILAKDEGSTDGSTDGWTDPSTDRKVGK